MNSNNIGLVYYRFSGRNCLAIKNVYKYDEVRFIPRDKTKIYILMTILNISYYYYMIKKNMYSIFKL